jgi:hypothetical protein
VSTAGHTIMEVTGNCNSASADLHSNIKFVQYLLEILLAALEEKMGARSSKLGPDDDKRLDKLRKRRLTGNKGSSGSVNAIPSNVQDSPYPGRSSNGVCTCCA